MYFSTIKSCGWSILLQLVPTLKCAMFYVSLVFDLFAILFIIVVLQLEDHIRRSSLEL